MDERQVIIISTEITQRPTFASIAITALGGAAFIVAVLIMVVLLGTGQGAFLPAPQFLTVFPNLENLKKPGTFQTF